MCLKKKTKTKINRLSFRFFIVLHKSLAFKRQIEVTVAKPIWNCIRQKRVFTKESLGVANLEIRFALHTRFF